MATIHPFPARRSILCAMHGIMTRTTAPGWVDALVRRAARHRPDIVVVGATYFAGPAPRLTHLLTNRRQVRAMTRRLSSFPPDMPLHFAAHSNGAVIAMGVMDRLLSDGRPVDTATLIQAALPSSARTLSRRYPHAMGIDAPDIEAWCSPADRIVGRWLWPLRWLRWPWGDLGGRGLQPGDLPMFRSVIDPQHNHSSRFTPTYLPDTLDAILDRVPTVD